MPRNINIKQDPLAQALDAFSQTFNSTVSRTLEQRGINERRDIEVQDMRTVQAMDKIIAQISGADSNRTKELRVELNKVAESGSPKMNVLGQTFDSYLEDKIGIKEKSEGVVARTNETLMELSKSVRANKNLEEGVNAAFFTRAVEKNMLDEFADIDNALLDDSMKNAVNLWKDIDTYNKAFTGIYRFDTDSKTEGIQFGEDVGEGTKAMVMLALDRLKTDPTDALSMVNKDIPTAVLYDVKYKEQIKKEIATAQKVAKSDAITKQEKLKVANDKADIGLARQIEKSLVLDRSSKGVDSGFKEAFGTDLRPIDAASDRLTVKVVMEAQDDVKQRIERLIEYGDMGKTYGSAKEATDNILDLTDAGKRKALQNFDFYSGIDSAAGRDVDAEHQAFFNLLELNRHYETVIGRLEDDNVTAAANIPDVEINKVPR